MWMWCIMWFGEYLDYENCKYIKRLIDKLVEEYIENIDEVKITIITVQNNEHKCKSSCTFYIALFSIIFIINIGIGFLFVCYLHINCSKRVVDNKNVSGSQTLIYWAYKW